MTNASLIVPIQLDTLVINKKVISRDRMFRRWRFNYDSLKDFSCPEPEAFNHQSGTIEPGIYLHWNLPRALRNGEQDPYTGKFTYPLVPNRWLIMRFSGKEKRECKAWLIESDCPLTDGVKEKFPDASVERMSAYVVDPSIIRAWKSSSDKLRNTIDLDPEEKGPHVANIGVVFPLTKGWEERAKGTSFLTAVAPGNPAFSIYCPHNTGVFSMYDDLLGIDTDTISYQVTGWYSDLNEDILASWLMDKKSADPYNSLLQKLNWKTRSANDERPTRSFYEGISLSINWDLNGDQPLNDPLQQIRDSGKLNVSIGNTTIDSFSALVGKQLEDSGQSPQKAKLLRAFLYDQLPVLNKINGDALLENKIIQEWFNSETGGTRWVITEKNSDGDIEAQLTPQENSWLSELNSQQEIFDETMNELTDLQWQLHAAWWKLGRNPDSIFPESPGITNAELQNYLDPENQNGITAKLLKQVNALQKLKSGIPFPQFEKNKKPEELFVDSIKAFARERKLDEEKVLKAIPSSRYWKTNNPVITISGLEPSGASDPDEELLVRTSSQLITGFVCDGKKISVESISKAIPVLNGSSSIPPVCSQLINELFFVDPASSFSIAKESGITEKQINAFIKKQDAQSYTGLLPAWGLEPWSQPWEPVFMEWKINYTHIPFETGGKPNWKFNGTDYTYSPQEINPETEDVDIGGISLLGSHTQSLFRRRLKEYVQKYKNEELNKLNEWLTATDDWKFISQELTGFHDRMALRDSKPFRRPGSKDILAGDTNLAVANLSGFKLQNSPIADHSPVRVKSVPYLRNGEKIKFHGIRHGQLYFEELAVYDKFGRVLWIIDDGNNSGLYDSKNFPLIRANALLPENPVHNTVASVVQLAPRLLQHARLDFSFADDHDNLNLMATSTNPVGGWIIPNHLDQSLLLYAADGKGIGEFRLFVQAGGNKIAMWQAPLDGHVNSIDDIKKLSPLIFNMISDPELKNEIAFRAFMKAIDETLWTIDPLGERDDRNLSVLIGRPLALVRSRVQLRLAGPPLRDTSWAATFNPPLPDFINSGFDIRLGDQPTREDGLIGYFRKNNYSVFNSIISITGYEDQKYVKPVSTKDGKADFIRLKFAADNYEYLTLLVDPRASIHAYSGILPVKQIEIPAAYIGYALRNIELSFRTGPVLTSIEKSPAQGDQKPEHEEAINFPLPAEKNGTWVWWEKSNDGKTANGFEVESPFSNRGITNAANALRDGSLKLKVDTSK